MSYLLIASPFIKIAHQRTSFQHAGFLFHQAHEAKVIVAAEMSSRLCYAFLGENVLSSVNAAPIIGYGQYE